MSNSKYEVLTLELALLLAYLSKNKKQITAIS